MAGSTSPPEWLRPGAEVRHHTFGTGVVHSVDEYKGLPSVWVDFDFGARKGLALEFAIPHLRTDLRLQRTAPDQAIRCDVCGSRPVVLSAGSQQYCEAHINDYDPTRL